MRGRTKVFFFFFLVESSARKILTRTVKHGNISIFMALLCSISSSKTVFLALLNGEPVFGSQESLLLFAR